MKSTQKKAVKTPEILNRYNPLRLSPIEYAENNYSEALVKALKQQKRFFVAIAGGGIVLGVLIAFVGAKTGLSGLSIGGIMFSLACGYIAPIKVGHMWTSYRRAYNKSEKALYAWEEAYGIRDSSETVEESDE